MDIAKLRPRHLLSRSSWQRAFYSIRDLAREPVSPSTPRADVAELYAPHPEALPLDRILTVLFAAPRYDYGDPRRGEGIEEYYFLKALVGMGHRVVRFDSLELARKHGKAAMNHMLVEAVERYRPDVLMAVMFKDEFEPAVIIRVTEKLEGRTLNWFCDDHWRFESYSRRWAKHFGWAVTTSRAAQKKYNADGISNVILSQWGCNHFVYHPLPIAKQFDVSFVGQPHGDRPRVIAALRRAGIDVSVWGLGWPAGRVGQEEMMRIFNASRINLNLSNASVGGVDQVKGRDFEIPGCRGFMITKRTDELLSYYEPGIEVEAYRDKDELIDKVKHFISADEQREQIAARGYERTLGEHTMESRLSSIFQTVMNGCA